MEGGDTQNWIQMQIIYKNKSPHKTPEPWWYSVLSLFPPLLIVKLSTYGFSFFIDK